MNELALFAGAGGGMLGGIFLGWRPIGAVESDRYCREVLLRRQRDGMFSLFPIWDDVRTFRLDNPATGPFCEAVRGLDKLVVTAGFPCQPYSVAGKGKGESDERNLWPDTIRIIREVGPGIALLENVPGLVRFDYFGEILGDLGEAGYDVEWDVVSAAECGAPHERKRLWILAYTECVSRIQVNDVNRSNERKYIGSWASDATRSIVCVDGVERRFPDGLGGMADGVASRVDRLKAIGNGQVSIVAAIAFLRLAARAGLDLTGWVDSEVLERVDYFGHIERS